MKSKSFSLALGYLAVLGCAVILLAMARSVSARTPEPAAAPQDPRLKNAWRFERDQWIYVHLEGSPADIGYQHGYLLAPEIEDLFRAIQLQDTHRTKRDWGFFRQTAREVLWPGIDAEYREELTGIVEGLNARGVKMDLDDVVALNAIEEVPDYYIPVLDKQQKRASAPRLVPPGNCSAFVATGSYTKDGQIVMAHNAWTSIVPGARWRIMLDIVPARGYRMLMDGLPGIITSDDDFGVNSAGLMISETTITLFEGFDPKGKPEFVRSRKAMQYAGSIDEYVKIMLDGNNGGYANDWLLGDQKTGEIARFELGLKHHRVWKTKDGYFEGSNFPSDPQVLKEETTFDPNNPASSPNARRARWQQLMAEHKGKIDTALAQKFLSDHYDTYEKKEVENERGLCGHVYNSPRAIPEWGWGAHYPGGAVQGKATDSSMTKAMTLVARRGHPCGADFIAADFLKAHPAYDWERSILTDMKAGPWTTFKSGQRK